MQACRGLSRLVITALLLMATAACATDHRKDIAFRTLFLSDGHPDTQVFAAALSAKFPPGSSVESLQAFVVTNGGSCRVNEQGHLWCELVTRSKFCAASMLGIDVTLESGAVGALAVKGGGLGC